MSAGKFKLLTINPDDCKAPRELRHASFGNRPLGKLNSRTCKQEFESDLYPVSKIKTLLSKILSFKRSSPNANYRSANRLPYK